MVGSLPIKLSRERFVVRETQGTRAGSAAAWRRQCTATPRHLQHRARDSRARRRARRKKKQQQHKGFFLCFAALQRGTPASRPSGRPYEHGKNGLTSPGAGQQICDRGSWFWDSRPGTVGGRARSIRRPAFLPAHLDTTISQKYMSSRFSNSQFYKVLFCTTIVSSNTQRQCRHHHTVTSAACLALPSRMNTPADTDTHSRANARASGATSSGSSASEQSASKQGAGNIGPAAVPAAAAAAGSAAQSSAAPAAATAAENAQAAAVMASSKKPSLSHHLPQSAASPATTTAAPRPADAPGNATVSAGAVQTDTAVPPVLKDAAVTSQAVRAKASNTDANVEGSSARDPAARFSSTAAACSIKRKYRSKSLPNINFSRRNRHRHYHHQHSSSFYKQQNKHISCSKKKSSSSTRHHHRGLRNAGANLSCSIPLSSSSNNTDLPPVNIQSLKEIDLSEIVKNPQLRHDILFDPQLQFRPNLDGERGKRKKVIVDKYWKDIQLECNNYFQLSNNNSNIAVKKVNSIDSPSSFEIHNNNPVGTKLPKLFHTLRDILLTLLQPDEKATVFEIMDIDLLLQQLRKGVVDFVSLSTWLASVFKANCAPMRDFWVDEMQQKFIDAHRQNSIPKLVEGLRLVFNILEAMKLDVANHQIRVYRPILVENAVEFERDYFNQMINVHKLKISDSLTWYVNSYKKQLIKDSRSNKYKLLIPDKLQRDSFFEKSPIYLRNVLISAVIQLLSCREMTTEFPSTLCFDHSRLILFRADVRQLVCLQICLYLYKQLVSIYNPKMKFTLLNKSTLLDIKIEILALITDDNGNVKWTRNIPSIAVQLAKRATAESPTFLSSSSSSSINNSSSNSTAAPPPESVVTFAHSWLLKQTQPKSDVYKLMEERTFAQLRSQIISVLESCSIVNNNNSSNNTAVNIGNSSLSNSSSNGGTPSPGRRLRKLGSKGTNEGDDESDSDIENSHVSKKRKIGTLNSSTTVINNNDSSSSSNNNNNLFGVMSSLTSIDGIPSRTNSPNTDSTAAYNSSNNNKPALASSASTSSLLNSMMSKEKQTNPLLLNNNGSLTPTGTGANGGTVGEEISVLANKMAVLCNFNWCVLGNHYINAVKEANNKLKDDVDERMKLVAA